MGLKNCTSVISGGNPWLLPSAKEKHPKTVSELTGQFLVSAALTLESVEPVSSWCLQAHHPKGVGRGWKWVALSPSALTQPVGWPSKKGITCY